ncbi:MAG: orotate phosphoribosyltransferase [Mycoplasma sp.]|nr:orotate phosphoribosyltransferase [Candidatus Hennigella equi]
MQELIAKDLLSIKAVFLSPNEPFTWASGIKSPIYCDNRLTLSAPKIRYDIEQALADIIQSKYPKVDVIIGTSTAGIPHAAIVGHLLNKPMGYVRSKSKDHGRKNRIEGKVLPGQSVVVIEDLVSTGGSCIDVVKHLREQKINVLGVVSIFTYGMQKSVDAFEAEKIENTSLTNFDVIVKIAAAEGYIKEEDKKKLIAFRNNPSDESWIKE